MNQYFDIYVKEHLQEILCTAEKSQALSRLNKIHPQLQKQDQQIKSLQLTIPEIQLQDCASSPSFSQSRL
jgi:hypothetical protein